MNQARQIIIEELERMEAESAAISYQQMESECMLKEWGRWGRRNHIRLGYPKLPAFSPKGWGEPDLSEIVVDIDDAQGMEIDAAISQLPKIHNDVIKSIYLYRVPWLKLPLVLRMSRIRIESYQNQSIGIVWSLLRN